MHKLSHLVFLLLYLGIPSQTHFGQNLQKEWTRTYSADPIKTNTPVSALIAPDGALVVAGTSENSTGDKNYQVIKYRTNGEEIWRATFSSLPAGAADVVRAMSIDQNGNIFVTGTTTTVKFNGAGQEIWNVPVPGRALIATAEYVYVAGGADVDIVTVQLRNNGTDGEENWRKIWDASGYVDIGQVVTLDNNGNVYVAGQMGSDCAGSCYNTFAVVSYSPSGVQRFSGYMPQVPLNYAEVNSITVMEDGSPVLFGMGQGPGPVFAKFSPTGVFEWKHTLFTLSANYGSRMIWDRLTGNFVIAGRRYSPENEFIEGFVGTIKQDRAYSRVWSSSRPATTTDIVQDSKGNLIAVGNTTDDGATSLMFTAKLTPQGQQIAHDRYVSPGKVSAYAVAVDADRADNVYVIGYTKNSQGGLEWITVKYPAPPKIEKKTSGAMHIEFQTSPGQQYALEATTNFFDWQSLVTNTADASGIVQFDDTEAPNIPYRFYRGKTTTP